MSDYDDSLDERVEVVAVFSRGHVACRPVKFRRKSGREVVVTEVGLVHPRASGKRMVWVFDVTDGGADYRLEMDAETLVWKLTAEGDGVDVR